MAQGTTNRRYNPRRTHFNPAPSPFIHTQIFINSNFRNDAAQLAYPSTRSSNDRSHFSTSNYNHITNDYPSSHPTQRGAHVNLFGEQIYISPSAMSYAVDQYIPPIRILCDPKVNNHNVAEEIIEELLVFIEKGFRQLNPDWNKTVDFDYWYIDKTGDLMCLTRQLELYIYFCDPRNYPSSVTTTDIHVARPKHLPWQRMIRLNFVPNYITLEEIRRTLFLYFKSIYQIQEVQWTHSGAWRHLRLELLLKSEHDELVNDAEIMINGHLIPIKPYFLPLRIQLCLRCNDPGHFHTACDFPYEACRRCGEDKSIGDHENCFICCHRCQQRHWSNDYRCPHLIKYRRALYSHLTQQNQLLKPNFKIYIPVEHRYQHRRNDHLPPRFAVQNNPMRRRDVREPVFNINDHEWPALPKMPLTPIPIHWTRYNEPKSEKNTETAHNPSESTDDVDNVAPVTVDRENQQDETVLPSSTEQESEVHSDGSKMENTADARPRKRVRFQEVCNRLDLDQRTNDIVDDSHPPVKQVNEHTDNS